MTIQSWNNYFTRREQALAEIEAAGLVLIEVDLRQEEIDLKPHQHDYAGYFYVLEGVLEVHETDTGAVHKVPEGGKVVVDYGTRHAGAHFGYRALIGATVDLVARAAS